MMKDLKTLSAEERRRLLESELQTLSHKYSDQKAKVTCSISSSGKIECSIQFEL
jgi:hypothetical protein